MTLETDRQCLKYRENTPYGKCCCLVINSRTSVVRFLYSTSIFCQFSSEHSSQRRPYILVYSLWATLQLPFLFLYLGHTVRSHSCKPTPNVESPDLLICKKSNFKPTSCSLDCLVVCCDIECKFNSVMFWGEEHKQNIKLISFTSKSLFCFPELHTN